MTDTSFEVRIWQYRHLKGVKRRPWQQRWKVGDRKSPFTQSFASEELAQGFQDQLKVAVRRGEAFSLEDGLPPSIRQSQPKPEAPAGPSWYEHAVDYTAYKWPRVAATNRASIAWVIAEVTVALLPHRHDRPDDRDLRLALRRWALVPGRLDRNDCPDQIRQTAKWVESHAPAITVLNDADRIRSLLDRLTVTNSGKRASAAYFNRRRAVLYNALKHAVAKGRLGANPLAAPDLGWERPGDLKTDDVVDPRVVGNTEQVEAMLTAVSYVGTRRGPHLMAFYACIYYAMMRPSEVIKLQRSQCELPDGGGWGRLILEGAAPEVQAECTDDGSTHDKRGLKGRSAHATRPVPIPPRLVELLKAHIERFGTAADGRLFRTRTGDFIGGDAYRSIWRAAHDYGLAWADRGTPRLKRPYDLRHSGVSLRRTAGVPSKQVAEWAGHSVEVLERIYSKVLEGYDNRWQQQMNDFF